MSYLLDTHICLWLFHENPRLSKKYLDIITDNRNDLFISNISAFEISIKMSIKKLELKGSITELMTFLEQKNIQQLNFDLADLQIYQTLPLHHRDPFDRLIISQAIHHDLYIISDDKNFKKITRFN